MTRLELIYATRPTFEAALVTLPRWTLQLAPVEAPLAPPVVLVRLDDVDAVYTHYATQAAAAPSTGRAALLALRHVGEQTQQFPLGRTWSQALSPETLRYVAALDAWFMAEGAPR